MKKYKDIRRPLMTISTIEYVAEIEDWRAEVETTLRRDWVSLAGRFELAPGLSRIGADPAGEVVLPAGSAPDHVGDLRFEDSVVTLAVAPEVEVFMNGAPLEGAVTLRSDAA